MKPFDGKLAVVTGGSRGIGLAIASMLAAGGARVALVARGKAGLDAAVKTVGGGAFAIPCDVGDRSAVAAAIETIKRVGNPAIVVNNAGVFRIAPVEETSIDDFQAALHVNLLAPFQFLRAFLPAMKAARAGDLVTIGSIADRAIFAGNSAYAASKFGARALHEVLREELKGTGVRASLVSPGPVDTTLWDEIDPDNRPGFTPRREMLRPEAVARAVEFVLSQPREVNVAELRVGSG